ncbi:MAG: thioredoxin family protein [Desulfurococcales archaeon]|nr:thioredoxin family protein [Desulfurococcales archaeon]
MSLTQEEVRALLEKVKERLIKEAASRPKTCCPQKGRGGLKEVKSLEELLSYVEGCNAAIVTFYSPTCPYCRAFAPVYAEAARVYGDMIPFLRVNTWRLPEAAHLFNVMGVPMTFGIVKGRPVAVIYGYGDYGQLEELVRKTLEAARCPATPPTGALGA